MMGQELARRASTYGCAFVCCCALAFAACRAAEPATEVLVQVTSELMVGPELQQLRLQVYDRAGKELSEERTLSLEPDAGGVGGGPTSTGRYSLPVRFSVYPRQGATDFRIVVAGGLLDSSGKLVPTVEQQNITSFLSGRQTFLSVVLERACLQKLCTDPVGQRTDQTCKAGQCIDVPIVPPQVEPKLDAGPSPLPADAGNDASPMTEAGSLPADSGPADAAPAPGADSAVDASTDAGPVDAGPVDAGPVDAGPVDAGPVDAGPPDAGPPDAGPPDAGPPDAGPADAGPCGTWVVSGRDDAPPAGAAVYGHEDTSIEPYSFEQYVCRAHPSVAPSELLPGKGVYPYGCLFTQLDNTTQDHADYGFEVLSGTASCAQLVPVGTYLANRPALIPTGQDGQGKALYSCAGSETSVAPGKPLAHPLGRYDEATNDCIYEWGTVTHKHSTHGAPGTSFEVLVRR